MCTSPIVGREDPKDIRWVVIDAALPEASRLFCLTIKKETGATS